MSLFKKTMFALAAASLFIFAGCSSSDDLNVKVAEIDAVSICCIILHHEFRCIKTESISRIHPH